MSKITPSSLAIKSIHGYRYLLSPWIGNQCRFYPTCSHYAEDAINTYGLPKGAYLSLRRLLKCHPWHQGGIDLVPQHPNPHFSQQPKDGSQ